MRTAYIDRRHAGQRLASELLHLTGRPGLIVLALPRGGVPVAYEVALALDAPLDVLVVRKLGLPGHEELAMGAVASGGLRVLNQDVLRGTGVSQGPLERVTAHERAELARREAAYRQGRPFPGLEGRTVVLVDDGIATGATMEVAVHAVRSAAPARVIVAVPVAPYDAAQRLAGIADECICPFTPEPFYGVGAWYEDFSPTDDDEVRDLLAASRWEGPAVVAGDHRITGSVT